MSKNRIVYLVAGCRSQKTDKVAVPAKDLYLSERFTLSRALIEAQQADWLILSVMHGLVWPNTMLAAYNPDGLSDAERESRVERALEGDVIANTLIMSLGLVCPQGVPVAKWRKEILAETKFVLLGGGDSLSQAMTELSLAGSKVESPLQGLSHQQQVDWLNEQLTNPFL